MIIDLSMPLSDMTGVFPGDIHFTALQAATIKNGGYNLKVITTGTHTGTHLDVPLHCIDGGRDTLTYPLERLIGEGVLLFADCSKFVNGREIGPEAIEALETIKSIEAPGTLETPKVPEGSGTTEKTADWKDRIIVIMTGHEENAGKDTYYEDTPYFNKTLVEQLVSAGIKAVATDLPTVDRHPPAKGEIEGAMHRILLGSGIAIIECLVNLKELQKHTHNRKWQFIGLPLPIEGGDGSPVRACAVI